MACAMTSARALTAASFSILMSSFIGSPLGVARRDDAAGVDRQPRRPVRRSLHLAQHRIERLVPSLLVALGDQFVVDRSNQFEAAQSDHRLAHHVARHGLRDRKSTRLNSSHLGISYAVFCLKKKKKQIKRQNPTHKLITQTLS